MNAKFAITHSIILITFISCKKEGSLSQNDSANSVHSKNINPWFSEEAEKRGLSFTWNSGATGEFYMPESVGGGGAAGDFDNDGDIDIYLIQGGSINSSKETNDVLFINNGNGFFDKKDILKRSEYGMGATAGDYDNDGDADIYISNLGRNQLLENQGNGIFIDVTEKARVGSNKWSASSTFFDCDWDGDLDLFVTNYLVWSPQSEIDCFNGSFGSADYCAPMNYLAPAGDTFYRNNGDGTFTDESTKLGFSSSPGNGLGAVAYDFDNNGWIDLFIANDGMPDQLWLNFNGQIFKENALPWGCAVDEEGIAKAGMGISVGDLDNDLDLDLIVCNLAGESDSLYINEGNHFLDRTASTGLRGLTRKHTRFGLLLEDFNNDGFLDLFEANGHVQMKSTSPINDRYAEPNTLLKGQENVRFKKVSITKKNLIRTSRGAFSADFNKDGKIDICVVNRDAPAELLINKTNTGNFLRIKLLLKNGAPALHAKITATIGTKKIIRILQPSSSYLSCNEPIMHIGLGSSKTIENMTIHWPRGSTNGSQELLGKLTLQEDGRILRQLNGNSEIIKKDNHLIVFQYKEPS